MARRSACILHEMGSCWRINQGAAWSSWHLGQLSWLWSGEGRGDAGSARGGGHGEGEEQGNWSGGKGGGERLRRLPSFWLEQLCGWGTFTAMGKMYQTFSPGWTQSGLLLTFT